MVTPNNKATRPQKVKQEPLPPVSKPEGLGAEPEENKYARKRKIGPVKTKNVVDTVGLGKLNVETHYG